jgi:hypothetical protein
MKDPHLPAKLKPEQITVVIDTRVCRPLDLRPLQTMRGNLLTGDYSVQGLEHEIAIKHLSLEQLLFCVGKGREQFNLKVQRLLAYQVKSLFIDSSWEELEAGKWQSQVHPNSVVGSVLGWMAMGLPVALVGDHITAGRRVHQMLHIAVQRRWRDARAMLKSTGSGDEFAAYDQTCSNGMLPTHFRHR